MTQPIQLSLKRLLAISATSNGKFCKVNEAYETEKE